MEERITIELPIVKVEVADNWLGCDYAKEHYNKGLFIVDDGVMYHFVFYNGDMVWEIPCPLDVVETHIVEKAIRDNDEIYHRDMESIEERLDRIEKLCNDTNGELYRQKEARVKGFKAMSERFDTIERLSGDRTVSGEGGTNVLDVAKAFAVISKPELIKELNK